MRPLARYLSLVSYKAYVLPTYSFNKLYIFGFGLLHIFLFLESSRFVKFVLKYDRFLNGLPFKGHNFGNRSFFAIMEGHKFFYSQE
jgi:hypothetical protein